MDTGKDKNQDFDNLVVPQAHMVVPTSYLNQPYDYRGDHSDSSDSRSVRILSFVSFLINLSRQAVQEMMHLTMNLTQKNQAMKREDRSLMSTASHRAEIN